MNNTRLIAARCAQHIIDGGRSLDRVLADLSNSVNTKEPISPADLSFIKELVFGVCRWFGYLDHISKSLLSKPLRNKDRDIHFLLLVGLYQLKHLSTAEHAAIAETVNGAKKAKKVWAVKLLNACLRRFQREQAALDAAVQDTTVHQLTHPDWFTKRLKTDWPEYWEDILAANDNRPDLCLRVNTLRNTRDDYLEQLRSNDIEAAADPASPVGIIVNAPVPVGSLPSFAQGSCSVQDTAAQLAAVFLNPQAGESVLDACAAPGGKLAHIIEHLGGDSSAKIVALDVDQDRVESINETLARLELSDQALLATADASDAATWPKENDLFDKILIDAPCSGTGVIRRHPDIRHHRRDTDIDVLTELQARILDTCWSKLKPGGKLLYATCSVLRAENENQAQAFITRHTNVESLELHHPNALKSGLGYQTLPGVHPMDGFYYALFQKTSQA